jgi:hypothetical protein
MAKKKGFFSRLMARFDENLEEKSKKKKCCCEESSCSKQR